MWRGKSTVCIRTSTICGFKWGESWNIYPEDKGNCCIQIFLCVLDGGSGHSLNALLLKSHTRLRMCGSSEPGVRMPGFKSQLYHLLAVWPWGSYLSYLLFTLQMTFCTYYPLGFFFGWAEFSQRSNIQTNLLASLTVIGLWWSPVQYNVRTVCQQCSETRFPHY